MKIKINNSTELLIALLALSGELPLNTKHNGINSRTIKNSITKAKQQKLITVTKHKRIRIKSPRGLLFLQEFSPELYKHYMLMSDDHNLQRSPAALTGIKDKSHAVLFLEDEGFAIDNITLDYEPNYFGQVTQEDELDTLLGGSHLMQYTENPFIVDGRIADMTTATGHLSRNKHWFFTAKFIKHYYPPSHKISSTSAAGVIFSGHTYALYYFSDPEKRFFEQSEKDFAPLLPVLEDNAYASHEEPKAILIIEKDMSLFLRKHKKSLQSSYSHIYSIPPNHNNLRLLLKEDWKESLQSALYGHPSSELYDGVVGEAPSWELLSGEYAKIQHVRKIAADNPVHFICFEWQVPIVKPLLRGMNYTLLALSESEETALWNTVLK